MKISSLNYLLLLLTLPFFAYASEIHNTAAKGDVEGLQKALEKGEEVKWLAPNPIPDGESHWGTALHWAADANQVNTAKLLIKHGSNLNKKTARSHPGDTPIDIAAFRNHYKMTKLLLESGANIEGAGHNFYWPLYSASEKGNIKLIQLLIKFGANLNRTGVDGYSALHIAIEKEQIEAIKFLLKNKFNPNLPAKEHDGFQYGSTPLNFAKAKGNSEIIKILKSYGAK